MEYVKVKDTPQDVKKFFEERGHDGLGYARNEGKMVSYEYKEHDYSQDYLTFVALESGTFSFTFRTAVTTTMIPSISYSLDNGETWVTTNNVNNQAITATTPTVATGDKVLWKSTANSVGGSGSVHQSCIFSSTCEFNAEGNVMSLIYGDDFEGKVDLTDKNSKFGLLFYDCYNLKSAQNLILPATVLSEACYTSMFNACTCLTAAPKLPATTLASSCYLHMFNECLSLTVAPELPATGLSVSCYGSMFMNCTSLITAPELPATTLATECYVSMFANCTSLTTAPVLMAPVLAESCYISMFNGCTSLSAITCLATTFETEYDTMSWTMDVSQNGTFTRAASMNSWPSGNDGIPIGWNIIKV